MEAIRNSLAHTSMRIEADLEELVSAVQIAELFLSAITAQRDQLGLRLVASNGDAEVAVATSDEAVASSEVGDGGGAQDVED